ncbi:protein TESPA1 [Mixophyes fleayi]|uniref:protein TESPA1 n=1 Tax=Mixophyes fleayi TaxID=3061075 RepID=UPI003F4D9F85
MTCSSMDCPISSERRLAWTRSRHVDNTMDIEDTVAVIMSMSAFTFQDMDDAFLEEGCSMEMIQDWLQHCRSSVENTCEDVLLHHKGSYSKGNSLDDDFILGAEAILLSAHHRNRIRVVLENPRLENMYLGDSMASNSTFKTSSSISEVLTLHQADAESILNNLGFACEKMCSMYKIPGRFFLLPSKATGIDFRMFVESLLHRMKTGVPSYIPADHEFLNDTAYTLHNLYPQMTTT